VHLRRPDAATLTVTALDPNGRSLRSVGAAAKIVLSPDVLYYLIAAPPN
jgi:hypothetical protein